MAILNDRLWRAIETAVTEIEIGNEDSEDISCPDFHYLHQKSVEGIVVSIWVSGCCMKWGFGGFQVLQIRTH